MAKYEELKLGMRVRVRPDANMVESERGARYVSSDMALGKLGTIIGVGSVNPTDLDRYPVDVRFDFRLFDQCPSYTEPFNPAQLEIVEQTDNKLIQGDNNMATVSNDPVAAILDVEVDKDTRILRKHGFENDHGDVLERGEQAVVALQYRATRTKLAQTLRDAIKAERETDEAKDSAPTDNE